MTVEKITQWDWSDCLYEQDGYEHRRVPEATSENLRILADKINEIIDALAALDEKVQ